MRSTRRPTTGQRSTGGRRALTAGMLSAALVATAACGGGGEDEPADTGDTGDAAGSEEATIRFVWWGNEERAEITNAAVEACEQENPGLDVETESVDFNAYFDRLATAVAAGDEPDVITMGGAYPREYGDRGVLLDLETVSELDLSQFDEGALANGYFSDTQYGVPTGVNTFGFVINPDLFEQAGVEIPDDETWTWQDYADIAAQISANTPEDVYGSADPTTGADMLDLYVNQHTGEGLYTEEGGLAVQADIVQQWWDMTQSMMESGATPPASITAELAGQPAPEQSLIGQGRAAMMPAWSNLLPAYSTAAGTELQMVLPPGESTGEGPGMWLQASQLYTISANSEHPEASATLVNCLLTSPAAADHIGSDRGIPAVSDIRQYLIDQGLDPVVQAEYDYIERVSNHVDGDFVIGPTGSTETPLILTRLNDAVLFGQMSPQEAADQLILEVGDAIGSAG